MRNDIAGTLEKNATQMAAILAACVERVEGQHSRGVRLDEPPVLRPALLVVRLQAPLRQGQHVAGRAEDGRHVPRAQLLDREDVVVGHGARVGAAVHHDRGRGVVGEGRQLRPNARAEVAIVGRAPPEVAEILEGIGLLRSRPGGGGRAGSPGSRYAHQGCRCAETPSSASPPTHHTSCAPAPLPHGRPAI